MHLACARRGAARSPALPIVFLALEAGFTSACYADQSAIGAARAGIIYGADDRLEVSALEDGRVHDTIMGSVAVLIPRQSLTPHAGGLVVSAPSYGTLANLCPGERFAEQPAAALCSAVLIDEDLVVTAGHCIHAVPLPALAVVFGYTESESGDILLDEEDVISADHVVRERLDPAGTSPRLDFAFIRLSHRVAPSRSPAAIRRRRAVAGQGLIFAGATGGVPLKVDSGAIVVDPRPATFDFFLADTDTSGGASGGGAFDGDLALDGILARGGHDLQATERGCMTEVHEADGSKAQEEFTYVSAALDMLCEDKEGATSSLCRRECGDPCRAAPTSTVSSSTSGCGITSRGAVGVAGVLKSSFVFLVTLALERLRRGRRFREGRTYTSKPK